MDKFTAMSLLNTLTSGASIEEVAAVYKLMGFHKRGNGPTLEQVSWFNKHKGVSVSIKGTTYTGTIIDLNTATHGFYEGARYPVYVRIDLGDHCGQAKGLVFEYGIEQLTIIE